MEFKELSQFNHKQLMKIKTSHSHPDALLNYLVTTSLVKRELFFLSCELNYLDSLIISDSPIEESMNKINFEIADYMQLFTYSHLNLGVRGNLHDLIEVCVWDIHEYIKLRRKEFGKA